MLTNTLERRNKNASKTKIDWDLNVFCPEQWYGEVSFWDPDLWKINARIYQDKDGTVNVIDTDYTITLLEKEARALGLTAWADTVNMDEDVVGDSLDDWLDAGLDGFIDLYNFNLLYRDKCSDRLLEFLDQLPQYLEDVPARMTY